MRSSFRSYSSSTLGVPRWAMSFSRSHRSPSNIQTCSHWIRRGHDDGHECRRGFQLLALAISSSVMYPTCVHTICTAALNPSSSSFGATLYLDSVSSRGAAPRGVQNVSEVLRNVLGHQLCRLPRVSGVRIEAARTSNVRMACPESSV